MTLRAHLLEGREAPPDPPPQRPRPPEVIVMGFEEGIVMVQNDKADGDDQRGCCTLPLKSRGRSVSWCPSAISPRGAGRAILRRCSGCRACPNPRVSVTIGCRACAMLLAGFAAMAALLIFGDFNTVGGRGGAPAAQPAQPARLVRFNSSCRATVASDLDQGLTLLYAFEYAEAHAVFDAVRKADPKCCIASYFAASTLAHPIWSYATDASLNATRAYSLKAARCAADPASNASPRERDYLFALSVYANASGLAPAERLRRHADAMRTVAERHASEDENAGVLYGLSLLAVGYYSEEEPSRQWPHLLAAAAAEEAVLARSPRHPGALHLAIHAYDQPALASRALGLARRYAEVAGSVPHPIHMPSHIYSNLGLWSDVVAANVKSMNAALGRDKAAKGARAASLSSLTSAGVTAADAAAAASTSHQDWSHAAFRPSSCKWGCSTSPWTATPKRWPGSCNGVRP